MLCLGKLPHNPPPALDAERSQEADVLDTLVKFANKNIPCLLGSGGVVPVN